MNALSRWTGRTAESTRRQAPVLVSLAAVAVGVLLIADRGAPIGVSIVMLLIPPVAWLVLAIHEERGVRIDVRLVVTLIALLMALAVSLPPRGSKDIWSYVMYGRMVSDHGSSPYAHVPNDFPHDPFLRQVGPGWRDTSSVYGPVFIAISAAGSQIAGDSPIASRLFQQLLAAGAATAALALVWRHSRSPAALALLGINPILIGSIANGGHNDALVGLGVLAATLLTIRQRVIAAGLVLAFTALVKVTALLVVPALVIWTGFHFGRRAALRLMLATAGLVAAGYALAGPGAVSALGANRALLSRASLWQLAPPGLASGLGISRSGWLSLLSMISFAAIGIVVLMAAWWQRHDLDPTTSVTLALGSYLVLAVYVLPWYVAWMLPVACLIRRQIMRVFVAATCTFLPTVYAAKFRSLPSSVGWGWRAFGAYVGPILLLGLFSFLVIRTKRPAAPAIAAYGE